MVVSAGVQADAFYLGAGLGVFLSSSQENTAPAADFGQLCATIGPDFRCAAMRIFAGANAQWGIDTAPLARGTALHSSIEKCQRA